MSELSCETFPSLYIEGQRSKALNAKLFLKWAVHGFTQGVIIYYLCLYSFGAFYMHPHDGAGLSQYATGMACYTCAFVVQALVGYIEHHRVGLLNYALLLSTLVLYLVLFAIAASM